jgi:hypothetical protein
MRAGHKRTSASFKRQFYFFERVVSTKQKFALKYHKKYSDFLFITVITDFLERHLKNNYYSWITSLKSLKELAGTIGVVMSRKRLACLYVKELCHEYTPGSPPIFFFDRNPQNFPAIIDM